MKNVNEISYHLFQSNYLGRPLRLEDDFLIPHSSTGTRILAFELWLFEYSAMSRMMFFDVNFQFLEQKSYMNSSLSNKQAEETQKFVDLAKIFSKPFLYFSTLNLLVKIWWIIRPIHLNNHWVVKQNYDLNARERGLCQHFHLFSNMKTFCAQVRLQLNLFLLKLP